jgi:hypothetical protein
MKWCANYSDGTRLMQYEGDKENPYIAIERDKLVSFDILDNSEKLVLSVSMERPTQKLICRRRNTISLTGVPLKEVWLVGWHENIGGKSIKSICYLYEDGHIELAGEKSDIELIPQEEN